MTFGAARFWSAFLLVLGAGLFLQSRAGSENLPPRIPIQQFPSVVGEWQGRVIHIQDDVLEILGAGEFASRIFARRPDEPPVDFFLAYFASQRTGDTLHSPQNCLPGAGWSPMEKSRMPLEIEPGKTIHVNRFIIGKGLERQLVLYWYQAHGRVVASEYAAKAYLVADAIRLNRTDGALIRLISAMGPHEEPASAEKRLVEFAKQLGPLLPKYIPE